MDENPRTQTARDTDDRELIENVTADAAAGIMPGSRSGLNHDLDTQAELNELIDDPDGSVRPTKQDDINNNQAYASDRRGQNS
ncbi:hypothetical protein GCM10011380_23910 [Sphingomonas metalli]|uniref:Uncharacterized protein n=1 Tax=Sphingomonas metalli TaxID=1779358 RepID=A0A916T7I3_9SPHN|nr:hypothetical protein [Sphingomonas metalli]GGB33671.1 hypothetical protein GCM10011380_23910 [Sphingomonas metalli]